MRPELVLDLAGVDSTDALHALLAAQLRFPAHFGGNWDAFWDCVTDPGQSDLPARLTVRGFAALAARLPRASALLRTCLEELPAVRSECRIVWEDGAA
jgi:RNAse (barnase) inhibitor barstar